MKRFKNLGFCKLHNKLINCKLKLTSNDHPFVLVTMQYYTFFESIVPFGVFINKALTNIYEQVILLYYIAGKDACKSQNINFL
jgi:hypothetical protein